MMCAAAPPFFCCAWRDMSHRTTMPRMRAAQIVEFGDPSKLRIVEMDRPRIAEGEVMVAVKAAGVNLERRWKSRRKIPADEVTARSRTRLCGRRRGGARRIARHGSLGNWRGIRFYPGRYARRICRGAGSLGAGWAEKPFVRAVGGWLAVPDCVVGDQSGAVRQGGFRRDRVARAVGGAAVKWRVGGGQERSASSAEMKRETLTRSLTQNTKT